MHFAFMMTSPSMLRPIDSSPSSYVGPLDGRLIQETFFTSIRVSWRGQPK